ncbi:MAG: Exodeoxyribonuclease 7 small subunit [Betaproteobacteria bacterium ADurb.Bin341]|nr:MAG: Exodeoxyribonuclease 7 small subunit [Betaproteobacteria bacterium ADurb.Bin341]
MNEPLSNDLKFETALAALEQIVRDMEGGELQLEESIVAYRRGAELLKHCRHLLVDAEQQLRVLEEVGEDSAATRQENQ